jgi:lipoate-protein ligase A
MRLPRHDTILSLPAESAAQGLAGDEALLDGDLPATRWWRATRPALVLGLGLRHRAAEIVDFQACAQRGVPVLDRRAGGGAVLVDEHMLCGAVCLPMPDARVGDDITNSYRWLGERFARALPGGHRVEVAEARQDVAELRAEPLGRWLLATCFGTLSPHEVTIGGAKVVGLAQVRRHHAALFQIGILLRDQSAIADLLRVPDVPTREALRAALRERSAGVASLSEQGQLPDELA